MDQAPTAAHRRHAPPLCAHLLAIIATIAFEAAGATLLAQHAVLHGLVLDDAGERPLSGAEVAFPNLGRVARTDSLGSFRIADLPAGQHVVMVRLIGFRPTATALTFGATDTLQRDFLLVVRPAQLATVEVNRAAPATYMAGFEQRRERGFGGFITREMIDKNSEHKLSEIIAGHALGAHLRYIGGTRMAMVGASRGFPSGLKFPAGDLADLALGARPACYSQVYIDGTLVYFPQPDRPLFDVNSLPTNTIEAIETYADEHETPAELRGIYAGCGTLVIWTRHGK
ncbi:MAG: carboxypeptidase-like regulatory domain-containing protein [Gemmatimonadota bacterium]|nr:carboxypeptidase-like regulatory domain-containing protein [Gemmatimonadota bacterium]